MSWSRRALEAFGLVLLGACARVPQAPTPELVSVYATSAVYPWLRNVYECAPSSVSVRLANPDGADISLRLGEPIPLASPAYQIGLEDVLIIVHPQTGVGTLTTDQARQIFAGEITNWQDVGGADLPIQVWVFSVAQDVQALFNRVVMNGRPVTSLARLAVSAQAMADSVGSNPGSVGLLPRRWKTGSTREAWALSSVPVLAVVKTPPQGILTDMLRCLQAAH